MYFSMRKGPAFNTIRKLIEMGGGVLLDPRDGGPHDEALPLAHPNERMILIRFPEKDVYSIE